MGIIRSLGETIAQDEKLGCGKPPSTASVCMPCILVFAIHYFSTESVEVLTEREEGTNEPSTLFAGFTCASAMKTTRR